MLTDLRSHRTEIIKMARARGASRVRVFGSVERGDATQTSDIEFLVDLDEGRPTSASSSAAPSIT